MPTYDYKCSKCRSEFEEVQSFSSEPVAKCPKCGGKSDRQFSIPVVVYKGSGFYTTDHGRSSAGRTQAKKDESAESGAAPAKTATDSKDAAKPAAAAPAPAASAPKSTSKDE